MTDILIGLVLAAATVGSARLIGFDRDQAFYPVVLIVIAWLYVLFAAIDGHLAVIVPEAAAALVFSVVAIAGYKQSVWWLVAGYALHGGWDLFHDQIIANAGVPVWWPEFCLGYDGAVAVYLGIRAQKSVV